MLRFAKEERGVGLIRSCVQGYRFAEATEVGKSPRAKRA